MLPPAVAGIALFAAFGRFGLLGGTLRALGIQIPFTQAAVVMALASVALPFYTRQAVASFASMDHQLLGASRTLGAGRARTFFRVALPLARAPLIAVSILLLVSNWNAYFWPLLATLSEDMETMPNGIAAFSPTTGDFARLEGYGSAMAAVTLLSIPTLLFFLILQRYFIEGFSRSGIKG